MLKEALAPRGPGIRPPSPTRAGCSTPGGQQGLWCTNQLFHFAEIVPVPPWSHGALPVRTLAARGVR
jgi:hypothetical protein